MAKVGTWCVLRDSDKLKAIILFQMKQKKMRVKDLAELSGLDPSKISKWLRGSHTRSLTQFQLITVASKLGLNIDISISYKD
jgi:transcriptional regulator with XRE-family HTH domain